MAWCQFNSIFIVFFFLILQLKPDLPRRSENLTHWYYSSSMIKPTSMLTYFWTRHKITMFQSLVADPPYLPLIWWVHTRPRLCLPSYDLTISPTVLFPVAVSAWSSHLTLLYINSWRTICASIQTMRYLLPNWSTLFTNWQSASDASSLLCLLKVFYKFHAKRTEIIGLVFRKIRLSFPIDGSADHKFNIKSFLCLEIVNLRNNIGVVPQKAEILQTNDGNENIEFIVNC